MVKNVDEHPRMWHKGVVNKSPFFKTLGIMILFGISAYIFISQEKVFASATMTFDSQGTWIINGKREFIWYTHGIPRPEGHTPFDETDWEKAANYYHINVIAGGEANKVDELGQKYGIYIIQGRPFLKYRYDNPWTPQANDGWDNAEAKAQVREINKRPTRLYFWASEENVLSADSMLFDGYDYLHNDFPNDPAHINFTNIADQYARQRTNLTDFIARTKAALLTSHVGNHKANTQAMVKLRDEIPSLKAVHITIRGWGEYGGNGPDPNVGFNESKMELDVFQSIVAGINGVAFWELDSTPDHYAGKYGEVIARVGTYIHTIKPGIVAPNRIYKDSYMVGHGQDNKWYVVATPTSKALTVPGLPKNTKFERLFYGSGTVTTDSQGKLTDNSGLPIRIFRQVGTVPPTVTVTATPTVIEGSADLNADGEVDTQDWTILKNNFGKTGTSGWIKSDILRNGRVDIFDYGVLLEQYGQ